MSVASEEGRPPVQGPDVARERSVGEPTGRAFKELVFELSGGGARLRHIRHVLEHPAMTVRVESLQATDDKVWEIARVTGPPADLAGLKAILLQPPVAPVGAVALLDEDARSLRWAIRWDRPAPGGVPSLFHMVFDTAGTDALVTPRIAQGRIQVHVACPSAADLRRLLQTVERTYAPAWTVRLLRIGEPRGERAAVPEEDRELLARAIQAGYYDEPKRVGVRELGETLGWSKTVVSRRLRAIERRAVEMLAGD